MIDAVMNGVMPRAKMARRPRLPPENVLSSPKIEEDPRFCWIWLIALALMPGAGM